MDLFCCHGSILIYIFSVRFCFTLVCLDLSFDFFGIGLCCFELVPDLLIMVLLLYLVLGSFVMIWYSVPNFLVLSYTLFLKKCEAFSGFT